MKARRRCTRFRSGSPSPDWPRSGSRFEDSGKPGRIKDCFATDELSQRPPADRAAFVDDRAEFIPFVPGPVRELGIEEEDDLVPLSAECGEDVLQNTSQAHIRQFRAEFLAEFAAERVRRRFPKVDSAAQRPVERLTLALIAAF